MIELNLFLSFSLLYWITNNYWSFVLGLTFFILSYVK